MLVTAKIFNILKLYYETQPSLNKIPIFLIVFQTKIEINNVFVQGKKEGIVIEKLRPTNLKKSSTILGEFRSFLRPVVGELWLLFAS